MENKRLDYCYHTHTSRCGHAYGSDEEYVLAAIDAGYKILGFSDHGMYPHFSQPGIRGDYSQLEDYLTSIKHLKEKYQDKITIYVGFEADFTPNFKDYLEKLLLDKKLDYLLLPQHFLFENNEPSFYFGTSKTEDDVWNYVNELVKAMETGLFKYVCHPDLFMQNYPGPFSSKVKQAVRYLCENAKRLNLPLELNLGGIRQGKKNLGLEYRYGYPYEPFWEIVGEVGNEVIIGVDAHSPLDFNHEDPEFAFKIIEKYHLNYIDRLDI